MQDQTEEALGPLLDRIDITSVAVAKRIFNGVMEEKFADGNTNWGRIMTIFTFGGLLTKKLQEHGVQLTAEEKEQISYFITEYIINNKAEWIDANGGWVIGHPKYKESKRIAIFLSMPDEVQTAEIIKDIFKQGKECFIPRYKPQSNHMDMLKLSSAEDISSLALTSWNILQPSDDDSTREEALDSDRYLVNSENETPDLILLGPITWSTRIAEESVLGICVDEKGGLDLIFMPGLGFDKKGNRLGRGKGYYDTYLERCMKHPHGKPYTIALAFKEQICESVPVTENDVPIDEILYEDC
ncbi:5-formyltetrahydrofolate cyclo-ligase [Willisornis vidua]|uniref:5-formyltetrahydrofolate cyclo-ligase n=1 Tax=Willisornis vidua TaxID=1566151 RepID=A0ABQ9CUA5_9PASS|nr:5-formyltetrahydrofolate cyclo-ligase [Willisornis vidua]